MLDRLRIHQQALKRHDLDALVRDTLENRKQPIDPAWQRCSVGW
jgi:hypothetical protein